MISTPDTDVFLITLSKYLQFESDLFFLTGLKNKRRITDIELVAAEAYMVSNTTTIEKETFLHALLAYHCFTGLVHFVEEAK